jgi:hypothetical protein
MRVFGDNSLDEGYCHYGLSAVGSFTEVGRYWRQVCLDRTSGLKSDVAAFRLCHNRKFGGGGERAPNAI